MIPKRDTPPWPADLYPGSTYGPDDPWNVGRLGAYFVSMDSTWNDGPSISGSGPESCYVKVATSAYFYNDCEGRKCGRLINIAAWGHVFPNLNDPPRADGRIEINPFTQDQIIDIEELTVNFNGVGKAKNVASCYYNNLDSDGDFLKPIKFYTFVNYDTTP